MFHIKGTGAEERDTQWHAPMRSFSAPASSAPAWRCISPSAGLAVALVERAGLGEQTSFGNAGIIEGNTVFPPAFPSDLGALMRIALKRAGEANYHLSFLPQDRALAAGVPRRLAAASG